mgnify:CR=1 FL=1
MRRRPWGFMTLREKVIESLAAGPAGLRELVGRLGAWSSSISGTLTGLIAEGRVLIVDPALKYNRQYQLATAAALAARRIPMQRLPAQRARLDARDAGLEVTRAERALTTPRADLRRASRQRSHSGSGVITGPCYHRGLAGWGMGR